MPDARIRNGRLRHETPDDIEPGSLPDSCVNDRKGSGVVQGADYLRFQIMNSHATRSPFAQSRKRTWQQMALVSLVVIFYSVDTPAWELECNQKVCRAFIHTDAVAYNAAREPIRLFLEVDDSRELVVTALAPRNENEPAHATTPPAHTSFDGKELVPVPDFFSVSSSPALAVDGKEIAKLIVANDSQLKSGARDRYRISEKFLLGSSAVIHYQSALESGRRRLEISLMGFAGVSNALFEASMNRNLARGNRY